MNPYIHSRKMVDEYSTVTRRLIKYINEVLNREGYGLCDKYQRHIVECFYANIPSENVRLTTKSLFDTIIDNHMKSTQDNNHNHQEVTHNGTA